MGKECTLISNKSELAFLRSHFEERLLSGFPGFFPTFTKDSFFLVMSVHDSRGEYDSKINRFNAIYMPLYFFVK